MVEPGGLRLWGRTELDTTEASETVHGKQMEAVAMLSFSVRAPSSVR